MTPQITCLGMIAQLSCDPTATVESPRSLTFMRHLGASFPSCTPDSLCIAHFPSSCSSTRRASAAQVRAGSKTERKLFSFFTCCIDAGWRDR